MAQLVQSRQHTYASLLAAVALAVLILAAIVAGAIAVGLPAAFSEPAAAPAVPVVAPDAQPFPRTWQLAGPSGVTDMTNSPFGK